jgi:hypothetical protein
VLRTGTLGTLSTKTLFFCYNQCFCNVEASQPEEASGDICQNVHPLALALGWLELQTWNLHEKSILSILQVTQPLIQNVAWCT